jgi:hypothetical protein
MNSCRKRGNIIRASFLLGVLRFVHPQKIICNMKSKIKTIPQFNQKMAG